MKKTGMMQPRAPWLDNAKMVAMICVIVGHVGGLPCVSMPSEVAGLIVAFNMPLFVMLSGFTALGGLVRLNGLFDLFEYIRKLFWRIVIPGVALSAIDQAFHGSLFDRKLWLIFFILSLLLAVIDQCTSQVSYISKWKRWGIYGLQVFFVLFLTFSSFWLNNYWFLSMLMKLQLISATFASVFNNRISATTKIVGISIILCVGSFLICDEWTFEMSVYFAAGLLMKHFDYLSKLLKMPVFLAALMLIIGIVMCSLVTIEYGFYEYSLQTLLNQCIAYIYPLRILVACLLSVAIIRWTSFFSHDYSWFSRMGSYTLALYTIHVFLLEDLIKPVLLSAMPSFHSWVYMIVLFSGLFMASWLIILLCEKRQLTRKLILGK